jgi:hypothetical protein
LAWYSWTFMWLPLVALPGAGDRPLASDLQ